jgi:beta-glucosidase
VVELKGFERISLPRGSETDVSFRLPIQDLRFLDADMRWVVEPGEFRVLVGSSAKEIRLRGSVVVR